MTDSRILEDWLTFTFSNARQGRSYSYARHNISSATRTEWGAFMYCMNCGALWTMEIEGYSCDECRRKQMRMLVCRYRKITKTISIKFKWWNPATWWFFDRVIDEGGVWEYRLKESEARTGITY